MGKQSVMSKSRIRSEAEVKRSVMDYLKAKSYMVFRMQSGSMFGQYKGKTWRVQMNPSGTADLLTFTDKLENIKMDGCSHGVYFLRPTWIECKREGGKQSPAQKEFQKLVEAEGHRYLIVRSAAELAENL